MQGDFRSREERLRAGNALRDRVPREVQAEWKRSSAARHPIDLLVSSNAGRVSELVPIRYARMQKSPFAFMRGAAEVMAHDLAALPCTGLRVQACGDCHLLNFGLFGTPERRVVFDINDFDETLPGPWEWDVKRLAASFVVAAREGGMSDGKSRDVAGTCVRSYRERLRELSRASPLDTWYVQLDVDSLVELGLDAAARKQRKDFGKAARKRTVENLFPKIASEVADDRGWWISPRSSTTLPTRTPSSGCAPLWAATG
jgi:uncharacterized protein (DUF2252 family)